MIYVIAFLLSFLGILLQGTLFAKLALAGVVPQLALICVISFSYLRGHKFGMLLGFVSGLVIDLLYSSILGLESILLMVPALLIVFVERTEFPNLFLQVTALFGGGTLIYSLLYYVFHLLLQGRTDLGNYVLQVMIPELLYTLIAAFVVFPMIRSLNRWYQRFEFREE